MEKPVCLVRMVVQSYLAGAYVLDHEGAYVLGHAGVESRGAFALLAFL